MPCILARKKFSFKKYATANGNEKYANSHYSEARVGNFKDPTREFKFNPETKKMIDKLAGPKHNNRPISKLKNVVLENNSKKEIKKIYEEYTNYLYEKFTKILGDMVDGYGKFEKDKEYSIRKINALQKRIQYLEAKEKKYRASGIGNDLQLHQPSPGPSHHHPYVPGYVPGHHPMGGKASHHQRFQTEGDLSGWWNNHH